MSSSVSSERSSSVAIRFSFAFFFFVGQQPPMDLKKEKDRKDCTRVSLITADNLQLRCFDVLEWMEDGG